MLTVSSLSSGGFSAPVLSTPSGWYKIFFSKDWRRSGRFPWRRRPFPSSSRPNSCGRAAVKSTLHIATGSTCFRKTLTPTLIPLQTKRKIRWRFWTVEDAQTLPQPRVLAQIKWMEWGAKELRAYGLHALLMLILKGKVVFMCCVRHCYLRWKSFQLKKKSWLTMQGVMGRMRGIRVLKDIKMRGLVGSVMVLPTYYLASVA